MFVSHLVHAAPPPAPLGACTPGVHGIPDGFIGSLMCGNWANDDPHTIAPGSAHTAGMSPSCSSSRLPHGWRGVGCGGGPGPPTRPRLCGWRSSPPGRPTRPRQCTCGGSSPRCCRRRAGGRGARPASCGRCTPPRPGCGAGSGFRPASTPPRCAGPGNRAWPGVRIQQTGPPRIAPKANALSLALVVTPTGMVPAGRPGPAPQTCTRGCGAPEEDLAAGRV